MTNGIQQIIVSGAISNAPSIRLAPGQSLRGEDDGASITFTLGKDGVQLSSDNRVHNIHLKTSVGKCAILNDTAVASFGRIELRGVTTTGRVQILARDAVRIGHVDVNGLDIFAAERGYMVDLHQQVLDLVRSGQSWDELYRNLRFSDEVKKWIAFDTMHTLNVMGMYRWVTNHRRGEW